MAAYLVQLNEWGYQLAPIEQLMVDPQANIVIDGDPAPEEHIATVDVAEPSDAVEPEPSGQVGTT